MCGSWAVLHHLASPPTAFCVFAAMVEWWVWAPCPVLCITLSLWTEPTREQKLHMWYSLDGGVAFLHPLPQSICCWPVPVASGYSRGKPELIYWYLTQWRIQSELWKNANLNTGIQWRFPTGGLCFSTKRHWKISPSLAPTYRMMLEILNQFHCLQKSFTNTKSLWENRNQPCLQDEGSSHQFYRLLLYNGTRWEKCHLWPLEKKIKKNKSETARSDELPPCPGFKWYIRGQDRSWPECVVCGEKLLTPGNKTPGGCWERFWNFVCVLVCVFLCVCAW